MATYQLPDPTTVTLCLFSIVTPDTGSMRFAIFETELEQKYRRLKCARSCVRGRNSREVTSISRIGR